MKKTILFILSMLLTFTSLFSLSACDIFDDDKCNHDNTEESCLYCGVTDEKYFSFTLLEDGTYSVSAKDKNNMPALVIIPDTYKGVKVTSIPDSAFYRCNEITGVKIGDNVVTIGYSAFANCYNLTDLVLGKSITSIEGSAFNDCNSKLFSGYDHLLYVRSLDNPYAILIGAGSFQKHYTQYEIHEDTELIASGAMQECRNITELTIPKKVVSIGSLSFSYCENLETVNILSDRIAYIGKMAFYCCSDISEITIPRKVKYIGEEAFSYCNLDSIKGGNLDYPVIGNCLIERKTKTLMAGSNNSNIPYGVTSIANGAFSHRAEMTNIKIPKSVTYIGERAFSLCKSLESIEIPDSVTTIEHLAFDNCESLSRVIIGKNASSIGERVFVSCRRLTSIEVDSKNEYFKSIDGILYTKDGKTLVQYAAGRKDATFVIADGVTTIGKSAFYTCDNLESIVIPKSVKKIESTAFSYKPINIYYKGNEFQWNMIEIAQDLRLVNIHYNYTP